VRIEEQARHGAVENRITQKFQPLVMISAGAAVRNCRMTQRGRSKDMAERTFDPTAEVVRFAQRNHRTFTVLSKCTLSDTFATYGTVSS